LKNFKGSYTEIDTQNIKRSYLNGGKLFYIQIEFYDKVGFKYRYQLQKEIKKRLYYRRRSSLESISFHNTPFLG